MSGVLNALLSGGFSPVNIAGLKLWFDASDASTITQSGGAVSQWNDKSANANHMTQATGSAQPTIQTAAQNGLNTIRFTASAVQTMLLNSSVNVDSAHTNISVIRRGGPTGANIVELFCNTATLCMTLQWYSDTNFNHEDSSGFQESSAVASTAYNLISGDKTGTTGHWYLNMGSDIGAAHSATNTATLNVDNIGARQNTYYFNGEIAETVLYDSVLSSTNRGLVETYLKNKWATP